MAFFTVWKARLESRIQTGLFACAGRLDDSATAAVYLVSPVPKESYAKRSGKMNLIVEACVVEQIGETAGKVWHCLDESGGMSTTKLVKSIDAPRDSVMQAVGWLAREDKITIDETSRGRVISLND